jgi:hypothetical protein
MNRRLRVDFKSKRLELGGARIGQFRPSSPTAGELELESASFTYRIDPIPYGCTIGLYQGGTQVVGLGAVYVLSLMFAGLIAFLLAE